MKQEVNGTVVLPPLVFPALKLYIELRQAFSHTIEAFLHMVEAFPHMLEVFPHMIEVFQHKL